MNSKAILYLGLKTLKIIQYCNTCSFIHPAIQPNKRAKLLNRTYFQMFF